mgnify:CR=1 FL=1|tara:strand:- start:996 stop:1202 length:207 start_codon:yes stop_codon:yes gene_type:complete
MKDIMYIAGARTANYQQYNDDGSATDFMDGYVVEVFVPESRVEDIDRNDTLRREVTSKIKAAIESLGE